jgi:hypothetical protein
VERMDAEHAESGLLERDGDAVERAHMLGVRRLRYSCACGQWSEWARLTMYSLTRNAVETINSVGSRGLSIVYALQYRESVEGVLTSRTVVGHIRCTPAVVGMSNSSRFHMAENIDSADGCKAKRARASARVRASSTTNTAHVCVWVHARVNACVRACVRAHVCARESARKAPSLSAPLLPLVTRTRTRAAEEHACARRRLHRAAAAAALSIR